MNEALQTVVKNLILLMSTNTLRKRKSQFHLGTKGQGGLLTSKHIRVFYVNDTKLLEKME